jgi:hypothetical protein
MTYRRCVTLSPRRDAGYVAQFHAGHANLEIPKVTEDEIDSRSAKLRTVIIGVEVGERAIRGHDSRLTASRSCGAGCIHLDICTWSVAYEAGLSRLVWLAMQILTLAKPADVFSMALEP